MQKVAIIDIGSNSIRLVLFEIYKNHSFRVIDDIKESPRLGEGIFVNGLMKEENMNKALETLILFKSLWEHRGVTEILAFGTAAVRTAKNSKEFLENIKSKCNIDVTVLSGEEEAKYSFYGAINSLDTKEGLLVDMGGASCELVHFENRSIKNSVSLNFGSLSIMEDFNLKDSIKEEQEKSLNEYLEKEFAKVPWLKKLSNIPLIGVGGTIRNLGKIHMKQSKYPIDNLHNYFIEKDSLKNIYYFLKEKDLKEKQKIEGLAKSRADIVSGASFVFTKLIDYSGLSGVQISGKGIREGFLYSHLNKRGKKITDVFSYGLFNVCERYGVNQEHGETIYKTFIELFHKLQPLHNLEINEKVAKSLSYLCLSGINISYYDHDLHSFYTILNSRLDGVSHKELLVIALASSQQNKKNSLWENYKNFLTEEEIFITNIYGLIICFAKTFNRLYEREVNKFNIDITNTEVLIEAISKEPITLEIKITMESSKRFERLLGKKVNIKNRLCSS